MDDMNESKEFKGIWYLPNNRDSAVAGILHFNKGEIIRLELIGSLSNKDNPIEVFFEEELVSPQIIYGESSDAKEITLIGCHKGKHSYNFSCSFPLTSFICQYILIGTHLADKEDKSFNKIRVVVPILSHWLYPSLINQKIFFEDEEPTGCELNFPFGHKTRVEVELNSEFKLLIKSGCSYGEMENDPNEWKVNQYTIFEIESLNGKVSLFELLNLKFLFVQFLSVASLSTQTPTEIYLFDDDNFQDCNGEKYFNATEVLHIIRNKDLNDEKTEFLFDFNKIESEFSEIIKKWYSTSNNLAPIRNHLLDSIQHKPVFSSLDFLIVVQALEGYHRRFVRFQKNGRVCLKDRLEDLIQIYSTSVQRIGSSNLNVQEVVDTRDYFTHFFPRNTKSYLVEGVELFELTKKLRLLLICCILDLMGFSKLMINDIIKDSNNSKL